MAIAMTGALPAIDIGPWQDIRFSGRTASGEVLMRFETAQSALQENLVWHDPGSGVSQISPTLIEPAANGYQASVPTGTARKYLGLSVAAAGSQRQLLPVYYAGTDLPSLSQLTKASDDPANDQSTNYRDIIADYISFSGTKLYGAIRNRGGGFPYTSSFGTQINSYMVVFANPADDPDDPNAIAWGMVYWNVALGGLSPGLYKLQGTEATRIGDIESQVVSSSNLLVMSCNIADLLAQPEFAAWYDPADPLLGMQSLINRTTIVPFETVAMDQSPGANIRPVPLFVDPTPNFLPVLSQPQFHDADGDVYFSALYSDPEANFPLEVRARLANDDSTVPMFSQATDFSQPVLYRSANLAASLGEQVDNRFQVEASDDGTNFGASAWVDFERVLGIRAPEEVSIVAGTEGLVLQWQPVELTLLGNPVTPSHYRVEASPTPDFAVPQLLGTTPSTSYGVDAVQSGYFYRVVAVR